MIEIRPATSELLESLYGTVSRTTRAYVALFDGRVVGVAGVYPDRQRMVVFARIGDELRADKRAMVRGIRMVRGLIPAGMTSHALADPSIDGSDRLLQHMGAVPVSDGVYEWRT